MAVFSTFQKKNYFVFDIQVPIKYQLNSSMAVSIKKSVFFLFFLAKQEHFWNFDVFMKNENWKKLFLTISHRVSQMV